MTGPKFPEQVSTVAEVARKHEISELTIYT